MSVQVYANEKPSIVSSLSRLIFPSQRADSTESLNNGTPKSERKHKVAKRSRTDLDSSMDIEESADSSFITSVAETPKASRSQDALNAFIQNPTPSTPKGRRKSILGAIFSPVFGLFSPNNNNGSNSAGSSTQGSTSSLSISSGPQPATRAEATIEEDDSTSASSVSTKPTEKSVVSVTSTTTTTPAATTSTTNTMPAVSQSASPLYAVLSDFFRSLPPRSKEHDLRPAALPVASQSGKLTLVLDLDETLVHCSVEELPNYTLKFPIEFNDRSFTVYVRTRPHLQHFLARVSQLFEVVVFTASQRIYADSLLNILDPTGSYIHHRLFREHCVLVQGNYVKDLGILGRNLGSTMIVDNSPQAFAYHVSNGIPIVSWFEDPTDEELLKLLSFLEQIASMKIEDIRPIIVDTFRFMERLGEACY